jgi:DNA-binding transcriptional MerR regulator
MAAAKKKTKGGAESVAPEIPDKLFFRIGEAARLVGVEPHVLRYWESEFRLRPQRSATGQRMYRRKDVFRFLSIRRLLHDEGFTIAGARKALGDGKANPQLDSEQLKQVQSRIDEVRQRITGLRDKFSRIVIADDGSAS